MSPCVLLYPLCATWTSYGVQRARSGAAGTCRHASDFYIYFNNNNIGLTWFLPRLTRCATLFLVSSKARLLRDGGAEWSIIRYV